MSVVSITICFRELLRDVCEHYSLAMPAYGIPIENAEGLVSVCVELEIARDDGSVEPLRCWSSMCANIDRAEEDAARRSIGKLSDQLSFEVADFNLDEKKFYENLYARISTDQSILKKKFKRLRADYNLLRGYYTDLLAEKERYVAERKEILGNLSKSVELLERSNAVAVDHGSDAADSGEDPALPPGFAS